MIKPDQPLVSIIIVNTHEENFLIPLIDSIRQVEHMLHFEIIIVDNDSNGTLKTILKEAFNDLIIVSLSENAGFCKANNAGLRIAKGKYVLLLNPDTFLKQATISSCIDYFEKHSSEKIGAVACRLENVDGSYQRSFFRLASSLKKTLQGNAIYTKLFGHKIKHNAELADDKLHQTTSAAPWLCGAFLLMKRDILIKEEFYLDEDFFLYSDDVELGHRIRSHGYQLIFLPGNSIIHFGGGSSPFIKRFEQLIISEWLCMMKNYGKAYFLVNQLLLLSNWCLDDLMFYKNVLLKHLTIHDRREKIVRRTLCKLWQPYTFKILFHYHQRPSSSKVMLRYQQIT